MMSCGGGGGGSLKRREKGSEERVFGSRSLFKGQAPRVSEQRFLRLPGASQGCSVLTMHLQPMLTLFQQQPLQETGLVISIHGQRN